MFINTLVQMPAGIPDILCIAQITLVIVHYALLIKGNSRMVHRAVFNIMSKALVLHHHVLGLVLKNSRQLFNQSNAKRKPIATLSSAFSRPWRWSRAFALPSH